MSNSIVITLPHRLGAKEAKRRIVGGIELLRRNYLDKLAYSEANWNGDTANLRVVAFGQTATAQVYVMNDALRIEVQLKRLIADIEAGQVDVVVVYKVDRLTRALSDFAKLVEVFDRRMLRSGQSFL